MTSPSTVPGHPGPSDDPSHATRPVLTADQRRARRGTNLLAGLTAVVAGLVVAFRPDSGPLQLVLLAFPAVAGVAAWVAASIRARADHPVESDGARRNTPGAWFAPHVSWAGARARALGIAAILVLFIGLLVSLTAADGRNVVLERDEAVELGFLLFMTVAVVAMHEFCWRGVFQPLVEAWVSRRVAVVGSALLSAAWWAAVVDASPLIDGSYLAAFAAIALVAAAVARGSILQRTIVGTVIHAGLVIAGFLTMRIAAIGDDGVSIVLVAGLVTAAAALVWWVARLRRRAARGPLAPPAPTEQGTDDAGVSSTERTGEQT